MAADVVEGEGGAIGVHGTDVAEGHQAQLHERLETVADAEHEAVARLQQIAHRLGDLRRAEESRDELRGAVGLVATGEAAGNHDDLGRADKTRQLGGGFSHRLGRQVVHHVHGRHGAGPLEGGSGVVLAVVAGEHRNDHARSTGGVAQQRRAVVSRSCLPFEADGGHRLGRCALFRRGAVREHAFKAASALPGLLHHGEIGHLAVAGQLVSAGHLAKLHHIHVGVESSVFQTRDDGLGILAGSQLDHERAVGRLEQLAHVDVLVHGDTQAIAHGRLHQRLGQAAVGAARAGPHDTRTDEVLHRVEGGADARRQRVLEGNPDEVVARFLQLRRGDAVDVTDGRREGHERGRHVQVLERAGHGVLAADGAHPEIDLGHERAEHRRHGLAPALGILAQLLEVLLEGEVHVRPLEAGGHELRHRIEHGHVGAGIGVVGRKIRVEAPGQARDRRGLAAEHRQLRHHGERRGELAGAAEGHEHRGRADGGVEALHKTLVRRAVDVAHERCEGHFQ